MTHYYVKDGRACALHALDDVREILRRVWREDSERGSVFPGDGHTWEPGERGEAARRLLALLAITKPADTDAFSRAVDALNGRHDGAKGRRDYDAVDYFRDRFRTDIGRAW